MSTTKFQRGKAIQSFWGILAKHGDRDDKDDILSSFTDGRTTRFRDLSDKEVQQLVDQMRGKTNSDYRNGLIRRIYAQARTLGWYHVQPGTGKSKVDAQRLNDWLVKYSVAHKLLKDIPTVTLPSVITQLDQFIKNDLKSMNKCPQKN